MGSIPKALPKAQARHRAFHLGNVFVSTPETSVVSSQQKPVSTDTNATCVGTKTSIPDTHVNLKQKLPTPIRKDRLRKLLRGYPKRKLLDDGFEDGFLFDFEGKECPLESKNALSALENAAAVDKKINHELQLGRIAGPYDEVPCENFKCFPLAMREKMPIPPPPLPKKFRMLHNMTYPYDERSVNLNIPKSKTSVKYANIQTAIFNIQKHSPNAYMAKADISDAFRLLPLHPSQYHLAGFQWRGKYYMDKCLPMGLAQSCAHFEAFSDALKKKLAPLSQPRSKPQW